MKEHLGVAIGAKMPCADLLAQLAVVVDLAVEDHVPGALTIAHGLGSAGEIDDGEASVSEGAVLIPVDPGVIRAAVP